MCAESAAESSTRANAVAIGFGRYEPEGIYLASLLQTPAPIVQQWGDRRAFYRKYTYNGVPLHGYPGLGFDTPVGSWVFAVDPGRVTEVSIEPGGFGRYIKIEHRWGESLYTCLRRVEIESGQVVDRGERLGQSGFIHGTQQRRLHFGLRIAPYNRFDGWGGFTDPLPFFEPQAIRFIEDGETPDQIDIAAFPPLPLPVEHSAMRRP